MMNVQILCVGKLKEQYLRDACAEYSKRLGAFCKLSIVEINECKISNNPNQAEIER
ncbi:MAG: 23S rRNA (pseudouridine(1915)-N(3))-methyltransferase RlmH, partial [Massilioclostridium sp.]